MKSIQLLFKCIIAFLIMVNAACFSTKVIDKSTPATSGEPNNFLVMNDGSKLYGRKIVWKGGGLTRDAISIDSQAFSIAQVKGYQSRGTYYGRLKDGYVERIVAGKMNVYIKGTESNGTDYNHDGSVRMTNSSSTQYYAQLGDDGPMEPFSTQEKIARLVADCPKAAKLVKSYGSSLYKALKSDPDYLVDVFFAYNHCSP